MKIILTLNAHHLYIQHTNITNTERDTASVDKMYTEITVTIFGVHRNTVFQHRKKNRIQNAQYCLDHMLKDARTEPMNSCQKFHYAPLRQMNDVKGVLLRLKLRQPTIIGSSD